MDKSKFSNELPDELYPKLNSEQIAQLSQVGMRRPDTAGNGGTEARGRPRIKTF